MSIESTLRDEIKAEFEELKKMEVGTEKYKTAIDGIAKLMDKAIDMEKLDIDEQDRAETREFENDLKLKQAKEERIDKIVKHLINGASVLLPLAVTIWGTKKSFEFEKEGTITTIMGRGFINKLLPKK